MKSLRLPICALLLVAAGACSRTQQQETAGEEAAEQHNIVYGINADDYRTETGEVGSGETLGKILNGFGVSALAVDRLDKASKEVFPLRNIRAGTSTRPLSTRIRSMPRTWIIWFTNATSPNTWSSDSTTTR